MKLAGFDAAAAAAGGDDDDDDDYDCFVRLGS